MHIKVTYVTVHALQTGFNFLFILNIDEFGLKMIQKLFEIHMKIYANII